MLGESPQNGGTEETPPGTEKGAHHMNARKWLLAILVVGLTAVFPQSSVLGADPVDTSGGPGNAYLVAVGVGEFKDAAIPARPTADADAKALYTLLADPKVLGIPGTRARLFTSADATRDSVLKAIEAGVDATGKDDLLIIALFGRGSSVGDKPCFFTGESTFKERAKTALTTIDLEPIFKKLKSQKLLFLMDVSYKGFDVGMEKVVEPTVSDFIKLTYGDADREEESLPSNRVLIFGNLPFRQPLTKGAHGLFYATLADGLSGKADEAPYFIGYEPDGLVSINELAKYLEKEIPNGARAVGKTDKEKELIPYVMGQSTSHFWVSRNSAETQKVDARIKKISALVKDQKLSEEIGKEGMALLFRMPKLKWSQDLRKAYEELAEGTITPDSLLATRKTLKEGLVLPKEAGETYASKVTAWVKEISARYIKPFTPGELTALAIRGLYTAAEEPLPTDLNEALQKPKELTSDQRKELLIDARVRLGKREDLDGDKAVDLSLTMACNSLNDRYTIYTDRDGVLKMASQLRGRFTGIGVQIRRDAVRDGLLVTTPIKGSPAYRAGIQAGDLITEIRLEVDKNGKPLPATATKVFSTKGMKSEEAVNLILGEPHSPVTVVVEREGLKEPKPYRLMRDSVSVETVHGYKRKENNDWSYFLDEKYKIGYVHISQFIMHTNEDTGREESGTWTDLKKAVAEMKKSGLNGLVLDLRENPGGYLSSAVNICDLFVGRQPIVTVKPRVGSVRQEKGKTAGDGSFPMVVLINGGSASASEIVAACLQDHGRAVIVGERSYGKGSVQDVVDFPATGGELKYTIARYYPPSGRNIDKSATEQDPTIKDWGVKPDDGFEVKLSSEEQSDWYEYLQDLLVIPPPGKPAPTVNPEKDKQLTKGLEHLREAIKAAGKGPK